MGDRARLEEIQKEIQKISNGKAVGRDQIESATFKGNSEWVTPILQKLYNASKQNNEMPKRWIEGVITFIHNKNATDNLGNYRPITLINIIYKIWATIMSTRLSPILNLLTSDIQYAYKQKIQKRCARPH